ncbi:Polyadenylate-binding protein 1-B-binding protein [Melia azedarach]|uniref:Polyadenylate-binding protein 1-B-binding protein n=1 Tax=Melia azedarach TaxID=155640 RepID=A0ACC1XX80_MELAZ|nr:Polyadenylate-binding protein 1-B-binding protein [Melia azedarach]
MDSQQQQKKALGFFGILKETFKLIFSQKKVFSLITLALILPLSLILHANVVMTYLLSSKIFRKKESSDPSRFDISKYSNLNLSYTISPKWAVYLFLIEIGYCSLILVLTLLCTSGVVHTIYCIYTAKDITFKKSVSVVSKVWKRVVITFLSIFLILFLYDIVLGAILIYILGLLLGGFTTIIAVVLLILFLAGSVYITVICYLAAVVSVREEGIYGFKAVAKSRKLVRGKIGVAVGMLIIFSVCSFAIESVFENFVVDDLFPNFGIRIGIGILCIFLQLLLILFGLVVQTVIYFVCKSYHNENFEEHIQVPVQKPMDVQSDQLPV